MIEPNPHRSGTRSEEARKHSTDLGEPFVLEVRTSRRRSLLENFFTFSVIPSLLAWAVIVLLIRAQFDTAILIAAAAFAGGFVGWSFGDTD